MTYPTAEEFKKILLSQPLETVVQDYLFQGEPYAFHQEASAFLILREHLSRHLDLTEDNVTVVGSAKIGFSLSPDSFGRKFSPDRDIDVLIVDEHLFDIVWKTMLQWNYPRRFRLGGADWKWASNRINELYWGWFRPDRLRFRGLSRPTVLSPIRDLSTKWFNAFRSLSEYREFATVDITGRLYRTWDHALLYHVDGLRQISESLKL